jgi:hypothetical protein
MRGRPVTKVIGYLLVTAGFECRSANQIDDEQRKFATALRR